MRRPWRIAAALLFVITTLAGALFGDRLLALSDNARAGLRQRVAGSPLADAPGFLRRLESAYRTMWEDYCAAPAKS